MGFAGKIRRREKSKVMEDGDLLEDGKASDLHYRLLRAQSIAARLHISPVQLVIAQTLSFTLHSRISRVCVLPSPTVPCKYSNTVDIVGTLGDVRYIDDKRRDPKARPSAPLEGPRGAIGPQLARLIHLPYPTSPNKDCPFPFSPKIQL